MKRLILVISLGVVLFVGSVPVLYWLRALSIEELSIASVLTPALVNLPYVDLPLGETEALQERSERLLKLDGYLFKKYSVGIDDELFVYIAYWKPGSAGLRTTGNHSPDVCWAGAGWKEMDRVGQAAFKLNPGAKTTKPPSAKELPGDESQDRLPQQEVGLGLLGPIEYRLYRSPDGTGDYNTYFWNVWDHQIAPIEKHGSVSFYRQSLKNFSYFRTLYSRFRASSSPRFFIRIHSKTPLAPVVEATGMENGKLKIENSSAIQKPQSAIDNAPRPVRRSPASSDEGGYLIDHPEVRDLLLAIHRLTTGTGEAP